MSWLENLLSQGVTARLGWMLVHFVWQAAVVAVLLAICLRLLRRSSSLVRYLTACSALALIVALPVVTIHLIEAPGPAAETGPAPAVLPAEVPSSAEIPAEYMDNVTPLSDTTSPLESADLTVHTPWYERAAMLMEPALPYLVLGWIVGVFGLSAWHLGGWAQLQRLRRRMVSPIGAALQARLAELSDRLGVRRAVTMLESALVEVPTVVGWLRPVILLPASALTGLSAEQLEAVLAHELAHIRRYDYLVNILQTVVEILGFYHPAVWWVSHRIRVERENCCDDVAVRVCGDRVQYARALTFMEEIRHSRAEWAIAATGGSLLDRVARLLGRPATEDRRFAWLPGLIALLLVVGVVIPAAFALTGSTTLPPTRPTDAVAAPTEPTSTELPKSQIEIRFTLAEVYCDAVLDPETAEKATPLLARTSADNSAGPVASPTIEELQRPLGEVFSRFTPALGRGGELVDLLGTKGYAAGKLASPRVTVLAGETASFAIGEMPDTNALAAQGPESGSIRCTVIATPLEDQNAVRMDIEFARTYTTYKPGDPNRGATEWAVQSTLTTLGNEDAAITGNSLKRVDKDGRERLQLVLVHANVVDGPAPTDGASMSGYSSSYGMGGMMDGYGGGMGGYGMGGMRVMAPTGQTAPSTDQVAKVLVEVTITEVNDLARLDLDAATQIETILGRPIFPWGSRAGPGQRLDLTISEFLQQHIVQRPLPQRTKQALIKLLSSRGYLKVLANPKVLVRDREEAQIRTGNDEYVPTADPNQSEKIEVGTKVRLTPHVSDNNSVRLEATVETTNLVRPADSTTVPVVTNRTIQTTVTIPDGDTVAITGLTQNPAESQGQSPAAMVIFMTTRIIRDEPDSATGRSAGTELAGIIGRGGRAPGAYGTAPAGQDANDQILSRFIIAKVRPGRILDAQTKASLHQIMRGPWDDKSDASVADVLALETDKIPADQFAAIVQLLGSAGYIDILSKPTILSRAGQQARLNIGGDPNAATPGETVNNLKVGLTAQRTTDNWIRLDFDIDLRSTKVLPTPPGTIADPAAPPTTVQSTQTTSALTVPQDRYAVLSFGGLGSPTDPNNEAFWLMVAAKASGQISGQSQRPGASISATFANADLRQVLAEIAKRGGVSITADETVKPRKVSAELADASVEQSLLRVLAGTPYKFKKVGAAPVQKERPRITQVFQNDELGAVLQDLATITGVTIIADDTVRGVVSASMKDAPLDTALEMVLTGTPYVVKKTPDYYLVTTVASVPEAKGRRVFEEKSNAPSLQPAAYLVYMPMTFSFTGDNRRQALMDVAATADISIAVGADVSGGVYATMIDVPLDTALQMLTAGTPYVVVKKADHYEVVTQKTPPKPPEDNPAGSRSQGFTSPAEEAAVVQQYVNSDPRVRALNEEIAKLEVELVNARQTRAENHPEIAATKNRIEALKKRLAAIEAEVRREFEGNTGIRGSNEGQAPNDTAGSQGTPIAMDFILAKLRADAIPDAETAKQVESLLAQAAPRNKTEATMLSMMTTESLLRTATIRTLLEYGEAVSGEQFAELVHLLARRGYAQIVASPSVVAPEGHRADMVVPNPPSLPNGSTVRIGVVPRWNKVDGTVTMNVDVETARPGSRELDRETIPPIRVTSKNPVVLTAPNDRFAMIDVGSPEEGMYLMAQPHIGTDETARIQ